MAWSILFIAAMFEIAWASGLKSIDGFSRPWLILYVGVTMALSVWLLAVAMRDLPLGTAYAVWTGLGAVGTAAIGIIVFGEAATPARLASIGLIVAGIVGLKVVS